MNSKENIIIYTVNIGNYDKGKPINLPYRCLYLTDKKKAPKGWEHVAVKTGNRKESRRYKINSHLLPPHEISIYVDANLKINKDITELIKYLKTDIGAPRHARDSCVYKHGRRCVALKLDNPTLIKDQLNKAKRAGVPRGRGLTENCLIIRKNTKEVEELNKRWWKLYRRGSQRDQLSLPQALWENKTQVTYLPIHYTDPAHRINEWFSGWGKHLKKREWQQ